MKRSALFLCLSLSLYASNSRADAESPLDRDIKALLAKNHVPSVSIAQIVDGKLVLTAAYGMQSAAVPATPSTLYNIASLTKPIAAEVVLRLVSQGKVSLDEPMYRYWTDPDIAGDDRRKLLTPRIALSHQTGLPNWRSKTGGKLTFVHPPGETYGYSGEGYEYVARFAEKKLGIGFEKLAQELILGPTQMTDTSFTKREWFAGRIAIPADSDGKALTPELTDTFDAADLVYTTAHDYALFLLSVMNRVGLTNEVANEQGRIQVNTGHDNHPCVKGQFGCPEANGMGLGWEIIRFKDDVIYAHSGSDKGVKTFCYLSVTHRTGVVILTNGENGMKLYLPLLERLGTSAELLAYARAH